MNAQALRLNGGFGSALCIGNKMTGENMRADARFLRRVLVALVGLTLMTGVVAGFTAVHAMNAQASEISVQ